MALTYSGSSTGVIGWWVNGDDDGGRQSPLHPWEWGMRLDGMFFPPLCKERILRLFFPSSLPYFYLTPYSFQVEFSNISWQVTMVISWSIGLSMGCENESTIQNGIIWDRERRVPLAGKWETLLLPLLFSLHSPVSSLALLRDRGETVVRFKNERKRESLPPPVSDRSFRPHLYHFTPFLCHCWSLLTKHKPLSSTWVTSRPLFYPFLTTTEEDH